VRPDRVLADEHQLGDLVVALALADEPEHLEFRGRQLVQGLLLEVPADDGNDAVHDAGHLVAGQPDLAFVDAADGLGQLGRGVVEVEIAAGPGIDEVDDLLMGRDAAEEQELRAALGLGDLPDGLADLA
jgi:hypothetical protein